MRQPVDRNHQDVVLDAFDAPRAFTRHSTRKRRCGPIAAGARQPRRLLAHPSEMATLVRSGLRLDRDGYPGRGDRHRVDVSRHPATRANVASATPPPAAAQAPADRVLRAAPTRLRPARRTSGARADAEPKRAEEQQHAASERRPGAARHEGKECRASPRRRLAGTREPTPVLLSAGVVHATGLGSPGSICVLGRSGDQLALGLCDRRRSAIRVLARREQRRPADRLARRAPCLQSRCPPRRASHSHSIRLPDAASATAGARPRPAPRSGTVRSPSGCDRSASHQAPSRSDRWRLSRHGHVGSWHPDATTPVIRGGMAAASETRSRSSNTSPLRGDDDQHASRDRHARPRPGRYDDDALDRLADLLADRLAARLSGLRDTPIRAAVDAAEIARLHGKTRPGYMSTPGELGAVRLGSGPRPRLASRPCASPSGSRRSIAGHRPAPEASRLGAADSVPVIPRWAPRCCMCDLSSHRSTWRGPAALAAAASQRTADTSSGSSVDSGFAAASRFRAMTNASLHTGGTSLIGSGSQWHALQLDKWSSRQ